MKSNTKENPLGLNSAQSSMNTPEEQLLPKLKVPYQETGWRWFALFLMNMLIFGNFVVFDMPQPIETHIIEDFSLSKTEYSLLYSVWAFPSIIVPFIGGYLTDKLGIRFSLIIFGLAITFGQGLVAFASYIVNFPCMLVGRAIYSVGTDPLAIAVTVTTSKWFRGREVALAMSSVSMTFGIARAINSSLTPVVYDATNSVFGPMFGGFLFCLLGLILTFAVNWMDEENNKRIKLRNEQLIQEEPETEKVNLADIKHFKLIAWLIIFNFGFIAGYFTSFNAFLNEFYSKAYHFSSEAAGLIISINFGITAISTVLFGKIVDSYGFRASMLFGASLLGVFGFVYYFVFPSCNQCLASAIPQVFFGLLIGINEAAAFPALPLVLDEAYLGTGYGLFFVLQNILILVLPPIGAYLISITPTDNYNGYFWMLVFFGAWSVLLFFESIALVFLNRTKHNNILEKVLEEEESVTQSIAKSDIERR